MTTKTLSNRQFKLKTRPQGLISKDNFDFTTDPVGELKEGEALIKTILLSLDPTNRIWMTDVEQYMPPVAIGEVMRGLGIGQVVESKNKAYKAGQFVTGPVGWQEFSIVTGRESWPFMPLVGLDQIPLEVIAGAAGMTGLTAYFGLTEVAQAKAGQTVVISAAAGAVGSVAGQIGKLLGCRVVGIAGSDEKCKWLTDELGFDAAVNYKSKNWKDEFIKATPDGIDVNFENVGGEIMELVFSRMNLNSSVALCGLISSYNEPNDAKTRISLSRVLMKRINIKGFIVSDYFNKFAEATGKLAKWIAEGKLKSRSTIVEGLEKAPEAINKLFEGSNIGKLLIRVSEPSSHSN